MMRICLCGGGSLTHALVAVLGAQPDVEVTVLTRQPARWSGTVRGIYLDIAEIQGRLHQVSDQPAEVVAGARMVILCVPSCARAATLERIRPFVAPDAWVGCFPGFGGFDWQARAILGPAAQIFGLQRVPYVRKTVSYGEVVWISGIRPRLYLATLPAAAAPAMAERLAALINIPTEPLSSYLPVTFSASNATFHPARIYAAFSPLPEDAVLPERAQFYEDWDDAASAVFLALDDELQSACRRLPLDLSAAQPILAHYGASDCGSLTARIRAIRALRDRPLPMVRTDGGWRPDHHSSYFTEDVPYGLVILRAVARIAGVATPWMDRIIDWAAAVTGQTHEIDYADQNDRLPLPQTFGITDVEELIARAQ